MASIDVPRAFVLALLVACSSTNGSAPAPASSGPPPTCPEGFSSDGVVCLPDVPASCKPGTIAFIGSRECVPLGNTTCADVFDPDTEKGGCADRTKITECSGATRTRLSDGTCIPIGDCARAFPPSSASVFVDDDFVQTDATHFKTISAAVAAAPAGAIIAIDAGTYREAVEPKRAVSLVGRCASQVVLEAPIPNALGVRALGIPAIHVEGMTLRGSLQSIDVSSVDDATIQDVFIDAPVGAGIMIEDSKATIRGIRIQRPTTKRDGDGTLTITFGIGAGLGSEVLVEDAEIMGGENGVYAASKNTTVTVRNALVRRQSEHARRPSGAFVAAQAKLLVSGSVFRDIEGDAAVVATEDGTAVIEDSVIHDVDYTGDSAYGHGVLAFNRGHLLVRSSTIAEIESVAVYAKGADSSLELDHVSVHGPGNARPRPSRDGGSIFDIESATGVFVMAGANASIKDTSIYKPWVLGVNVSGKDTVAKIERSHVASPFRLVLPAEERRDERSFGVGIAVADQARAEIDTVTVDRAFFAGIQAGYSAQMNGRRILTRDTIEGFPAVIGAGLLFGHGAHVTIAESAFLRSTSAGILADGPDSARLDLAQSTVADTAPGPNGFGQGITLRPGMEASLDRVHVSGNAHVGIAAEGASGSLKRCVIARNPVAVHVQGGTKLLESNDAEVVPNELRISPDTKFIDNKTRIGQGEIALPAANL